jgi:hypothetical protein
VGHIESTNFTKSLVYTFFVLFHTLRNFGIDFIALIADAHLSGLSTSWKCSAKYGLSDAIFVKASVVSSLTLAYIILA